MKHKFDNILGTVGNTPTVRINHLAPAGINLYVKIEAFNPPGSIVLVSAWHANRDGLEDDEFDITADRSGARVLTFGAGIHYCVGANLARAEMQEGLAFLAERVSQITLEGEPEFGTPSGIYGLETLPVRLQLT